MIVAKYVAYCKKFCRDVVQIIMSQIFINIYHFLGNITLAFEGDLRSNDKEIIDLRDEVLYGSIPNYSTDKANLKSDSNKVAKDLSIALDEYKKEKQIQKAAY